MDAKKLDIAEEDKQLFKDYGIIHDQKYLKQESDIEKYFMDEGFDLFECGQGYYQQEVDVICFVDGKFYEVHVDADIGSTKEDRGDRLYWVEDIESVKYKEIPRPPQKEREEYSFTLNLTKYQKFKIEELIKELVE